MNQTVTVNIGAVLSGSFLSQFREADKTVIRLRNHVASLNAVLLTLGKRTNTLAGSMGRLSPSLMKNIQGLTGMAKATTRVQQNAHRLSRQNEQLMQSNQRVAKSFREARQAMEAFNKESARRRMMGTGMGGGMIPPVMPMPMGKDKPHSRLGAGMTSVGGTLMGTGAAASMYGGIGAVGIGKVVQAGVDLNTMLTQIGITAELSGKELRTEVRGMESELLRLSKIEFTNQNPVALAEGMARMVEAGLDLRTEALPSMEIIGKTATATGSGVEDISKAATSMIDLMGITVAELPAAFDRMVVATKEGGFETRDMAQYLPIILSAAASSGNMKGMEDTTQIFAMLQAMRKGAGSGAQAGTYALNVFSKMDVPDTRNRFEEMGYDLSSIYAEADARGLSRVEALVETTKAATGGDLSKIGDLFRDMELRQGMAMLIKHEELWRRVEKTAGSAAAAGQVLRDYDDMAASDGEQLKQFHNAMYRLAIVTAKILTPSVVRLAKVGSGLADFLAATQKRFPRLAAAMGGVAVAGTAVLVVLGPIMLTLGIISASLGAVLKAWVLLKAAFAAPIVGKALTGLLTLLPASVKAMFAAVALAASSVIGPILAIGAVVALVAILIYKFWKPISAFFSGLWAGVKEGFMSAIEPIIPALQSIWESIKHLVSLFSSQIDFDPEFLTSMTNAGRLLGKVLGTALGWVARGLSSLIILFSTLLDIFTLILDFDPFSKANESIDRLKKKLAATIPFLDRFFKEPTPTTLTTPKGNEVEMPKGYEKEIEEFMKRKAEAEQAKGKVSVEGGTKNVTNSTVMNITQQPGENGTELARKIVKEQNASAALAARQERETFDNGQLGLIGG